MDNNELKLRILTPMKIVLEEDVESVTIPQEDGERTICKSHYPFMGLLKKGDIKIKSKNNEKKENKYKIENGMVRSNGKYVVISTRKILEEN